MTTEESKEWEPIPLVKEPTISQSASLDDDSLVAMHCHIQNQINQVLAFLPANMHRPYEDRDAVAYQYRRLLTRFDRTTELLDILCITAYKSKLVDFTQPIMALQMLHAQLEYFLRIPRGDVEAKFKCFGEPFSKPFDAAAHFAKMLASLYDLNGSTVGIMAHRQSCTLSMYSLAKARCQSHVKLPEKRRLLGRFGSWTNCTRITATRTRGYARRAGSHHHSRSRSHSSR
jgi:hypothetical protein